MTTHIYPNYYKKFKCIADKCKHNCCIGWEIDIDDNSYDFYKQVKTDFGQRLKSSISAESTPHFILDAKERCPFLNKDNLCEIIINLGEKHLCDICTQHPRFHNELPDRIESGLGLTCEEAARLIIGQKEKVSLICDKEQPTDDEIILMRDEIISLLQNRSKGINERVNDVLKVCDTSLSDKTLESWCDMLLKLERLEDNWTKLILALKDCAHKIDYDTFFSYIKPRENEYEQFAVYIIYRHLANAVNTEEAKKRARFMAFSHKLITALGAMIYTKTLMFSFEQQVELARLFSSEIEYSDENLYELFDIV